MSLGVTWWHGRIVKRQDSYGPEESFIRAKFDEEAWESSEAWNRARWGLEKEANAILAAGVVVRNPEEEADRRRLRLAVAILLILEGA